jgi:short-subunit dehydrogenase
LSSYGGSVTALTADLTQEAAPARLIDEIRAAAGSPTALYFASNPGGPNAGFQPASMLTPQSVRVYMQHALYALIELVQAFLPDMLEREEGQILVAQGAAALEGRANMSGPGLALAAQRNYLQSLQAEVGQRGVFVGRLYIGAAIVGTPFHASMLAAEEAGTARAVFPVVTPETLADRLWEMRSTDTHESAYPDGSR